MKAKIFISYSHHDRKYLEEDSLMGYLKDKLAKFLRCMWADFGMSHSGESWPDLTRSEGDVLHAALV